VIRCVANRGRTASGKRRDDDLFSSRLYSFNSRGEIPVPRNEKGDVEVSEECHGHHVGRDERPDLPHNAAPRYAATFQPVGARRNRGGGILRAWCFLAASAIFASASRAL